MAYILKKTMTNVGTTGSPSTWTWKQVVYQYWDDTNNNYLIKNQSRVVVETYLGRPSTAISAYYQGTIKVSTTIDGVVKNNGTNGTYYPRTTVNPGQWSLLFTATYEEIKHNNDGSKTIAVSSQFNGGEISPHTASASANNVLETIPRGSIFDNGTGTMVNGSNIDGGLNIKIKKYVDSLYDVLHVAIHYIASDSWFSLKDVYDIHNNDILTFTSSELDDIYIASTPNNNIELALYLESYTDSTCQTQVGVTDTFGPFSRPINMQSPTFNNFDYSDTNSATTNLTKDNQTIIKGYSTLNVRITSANKAVANTRQTLMSHYLIDGQTVLYSTSTINKPIQNYSKDNITVYAVDERNASSSPINKSFVATNKYIDYANITKDDNQSYSRSDGGVGGFVTLIFSGGWWGNQPFSTNASAVVNALTCKAKYRISGTSAWSAEQTLNLTLSKQRQSDTYYTLFSYNGLINGDQPDNSFSISESYDIIVIVSDMLSSVEYNFAVHSGEPAIALYKNRASLGAKYDETLGGNQFWGDTYLNGEQLGMFNIDLVYPVGSVYITTSSTADPNDIFDGTVWQQIEDVFLLASGSEYTCGDTGGEETVTLTIDEIPSHVHDTPQSYTAGGSGKDFDVGDAITTRLATAGNYWWNTTAKTGGGEAHNNMPPYLVVCVWERIS